MFFLSGIFDMFQTWQTRVAAGEEGTSVLSSRTVRPDGRISALLLVLVLLVLLLLFCFDVHCLYVYGNSLGRVKLG